MTNPDMTNPDMTNLRYPIGKFEHDGPVSGEDLEHWLGQLEALPEQLGQLEALPEQLRDAVTGLTAEQLETPYRPSGWTLRQVVHHVPDSHLNSYLRFKWALTEDEPLIKPYDEARWAELVDYRVVPIETNLDFLALLHAKWVALLRALPREQLARRFVHPVLGPVELAWNVGLYAWHGRHHLAHVADTVQREGLSSR